MRIFKVENYDQLGVKAGEIVAAQIILKPNSVLGFATGSSPIGAYKYLIEKNKDGQIDFAKIRTVNLDEYKGLAPDNDQSYRYFMHQNLFSHVNIKPENTYLPNGLAKDTDAECAKYDETIEDLGGVDLQVLGIGHNGHIGFNEPSDSFSKGTNCVALTESTINANKRFFESEDDVPKFALTMGIKNIMDAKKILLLITGESKAEILKKALFGPITPHVPASILQLHSDVILVADKAALSALEK